MAKAIPARGFPIVGREDLSATSYSLVIHHPQMARAARPGQFVIVMSHKAGERIPLTIADFNRDQGTITLVVQAVGKTTKDMQLNCTVGSTLHALVGPMGLPSPLGSARKVICVGGGLGVAPIYPQARGFREGGAYVIGVLGFRSRDAIFWQDRFNDTCHEVILCTDDGSAGIKGLVSEGISRALGKHDDVDKVVAIGPPVMMKVCAEVTRPRKIETLVSLNPIMVDGTGMCGGCRVKLDDGVKFACVDGPDFDGHKVDFDDLISRLRRYSEQEAAAERRWSENCRMKDQFAAIPPGEHVSMEVPPVLLRELLDLADPSVDPPDPYDDALGG